MTTSVTHDEVRQLAATARPYSLAILRWGPARFQSGAVETENAHQRRMVELRRNGKIAILCPVTSDTICGVAILTVPLEEASAIMKGDPCVQIGMMNCEVLPCHGFPGDALR
jgi:hypothetical protein